MDILMKDHNLKDSFLKSVNRTRCYLKVFSLADITSGDGKIIKKEHTVRGMKPVDSEWDWPTEQPCFKDFGNWKKAIQILNENNVLLDSLGRWLAQPHFKWNWYYEAQSETVVFKNEDQVLIYKKISEKNSID